MQYNLDPEFMDSLTRTNLLSAYENCYWCYVDDREKYDSDPVRYAFKKEDLDSNSDTLSSLARVIKYFSNHPGDVDLELVQIQEKIDLSRENDRIKAKIARMGNESSC